MRKHIAILSKVGLKEIFSGKKTVESRFSQKKIAPFGQISIGDVVYLKEPGGEIHGQFIVEKVISFEGLSQKDWNVIGNYLKLEQEFIKVHQNAHFGTLIFIKDVEQFITSPINFQKKDQRGWVIL